MEAPRQLNPASIARRLAGSDGGAEVAWATAPLRGGLVAAEVARVDAKVHAADGRTRSISWVAKRLSAGDLREAAVYAALDAAGLEEVAPRWFGEEPLADGSRVLLIEAIRPVRRWPWKSFERAREVLESVARVHAVDARAAARRLPPWDYEAELARSADTTLAALEAAVAGPGAIAGLRASLRSVRRLVARLADLRGELLSAAALGSAWIHGDLHPGNVLVRVRGGREQPVLLDWARSRIGSPLEDASSWLQSLGYWEPEARRRHDSLLSAYLAARGLPGLPAREIRDLYWLAGASNALAGALTYYLWLAGEALDPHTRASAWHAAADWLRILRRADACCGG